jgi:hypothetical protein
VRNAYGLARTVHSPCGVHKDPWGSVNYWTIRPSWHTPLLSNLGKAKHGKLKADQWRSCIEFDVPTAMAQIWVLDRQGNKDEERARRQNKIVEATLLLATAICCATSYCTSPEHATQYMKCPLQDTQTPLQLVVT